MKNPRVTNKEKGLIKGAIRRVFSRSELRRRVLDAAEIEHHNPKRPRVKKWIKCAECPNPYPKYLAQVDHKDPVVPVDRASADMEATELVDRMWAPENRLQALCKPCHSVKTKEENSQRRKLKKDKRT